ncbi:site-specific integrase [Flavicella sp.]|uniref:site-specific integrase n=1 Tax=Flavicella sp. TaxID=2957742 RepID=UPI00260D093B|nr:site-specific integrase [Flavicella sp.]MDG1806128.1 site-specific integrase [Flavicella sp.]
MNFNYFLNSYTKKNGTKSIRLKISSSNKDTQYIDSKISIKTNQWDPKKQVVKKHPLEDQFNSELSYLMNEIQSVFYKNKGVSAARLKKLWVASVKYDSNSFIDFFQSVVDEWELKKQHRTSKTNQIYIDKLKMFQSNITFSDISVQFCKDYEKWMLNRGNKPNTIASNFKSIYAILNKAVKSGVIPHNPMKGFEIKTVNVEKISLSFEEIILLSNLKIEKRHKGLSLSVDLFLFSFYTAGMRFTDMCKLKWDNIIGNDVVYTMNKSEKRAGSRRIIPMNPKTIDILEKYKDKNQTYVFPILYGMEKKSQKEIEYKIYIGNNNMNRSLKIAAEKAGIQKKISMHMSKHSFADYAVKNDVGILMLSKLLGHTKLATTQAYLKDFYHKEESDTMNKLFG